MSTLKEPGLLNMDSERALYLPLALALISASILIWKQARAEESGDPMDGTDGLSCDADEEESSPKDVVLPPESHTALSYGIIRISGCICLVGLSIISFFYCFIGSTSDSGPSAWTHGSLLLANAYVLLTDWMAFSCHSVPRKLSLERHGTTILLCELAIYAYRDLWPFATYTKRPMDPAFEGSFLWAKLAVLTLVALIIPICTPYPYIPLNPKKPSHEVHPEQTASLLSFHTYSHLNPAVAAANGEASIHPPIQRMSDISPLADYDAAEALMQRALPACLLYQYLESAMAPGGPHVLWSLLRMFAREGIKATAGMTVYPLMGLVSPLAVNHLLAILESTKGTSTPDPSTATDIRPWFWILTLLIAPVLGSMGFQYYNVVTTRWIVNAESVLTQLVFERSLKVRVKAGEGEGREPGGGGGTGGMGTARSSANFVGRLTNLVTIDLSNIVRAKDLVLAFWLIPLQLSGSGLLLYILLGPSALVGFVLLAILLPVPGRVTGSMSNVQKEKMKLTDRRTQVVTESMAVLRMIKMFGWEKKILERIGGKREEELRWVWKGKVLGLALSVINAQIIVVSMIATFATATLVGNIALEPSTVFSSMILFNIMRDSLGQGIKLLGYFVAGKVSIDRLDDFLKEAELLDKYEGAPPFACQPPDEEFIGFRDACFTWTPSLTLDGASTPSTAQSKLTVPGELRFAKGKLNLIVGPTGSGKTSVLMALLGEMHFVPMSSDSTFHLPRAGGVAFAVQETWVQNETIRENILFNSPYDEERYLKVLHQCALEQDLELFEAGDMTEVGERGLTLSGGQKARLTLARAVYSNAEIILLDDVLAALDVHTASWVVNKCLCGDLVRGRTILLATHNVSLASSIADFVVSVSPDGVVTSRSGPGHLEASPLSDPDLRQSQPEDGVGQEMDIDEKAFDSRANVDDKSRSKAAGKLIMAEEMEEGNVGWDSLKMYFKALGGRHAEWFFTVWTGATAFEFFTHSLALWFLGYWSSQYEKLPPREVPVIRNIGIYAGIVLLGPLTFIFKGIWFLRGNMRVSRTLHNTLASSILGSTLRWLDETPNSRIITRLTLDIDNVDGYIMQTTATLQAMLVKAVVDLAGAVFFVPVFTLPALVVVGAGTWFGRRYLKAELSVKREISIARAPMLAHFEAAMAGLVSLRAYGMEETYREELRKRIDYYVRISRMNYDLNRWINIRFDILGALFTASLAAYLTYASGVSAANVGFSLNRSVEFCTVILSVVRWYNVFQLEANSLERIYAYTQIEQEMKPSERGEPPAAWPTSGEIRAENLTARYSKTGPAVLHKLTFTIHPGERIGVVGRTGSGKSSLTLSILRCIPTEGTIYFDGLSTNEINLDALRSNITIIPQMPELLSGTLRYNLDMFGEFDDATLNSALQASGLYAVHSDPGESRLTLDSSISGGGANLSVGQRQIIALARAIVRSSKLLILDEATSAVDHETDTIIQNTLRGELAEDVTVITIAHRLQTIIDADRIMVLDAGRIVEFETPADLLSKDEGVFKSLVDESRDRPQLYQMALGKAP